MSELELKRFKELRNEIYMCGEIWKDDKLIETIKP